MDKKEIESITMAGVELTPLKVIDNPKGDIYHVMKGSDSTFQKFGEAYFTTIIFGEVKGWKKHTEMQMNLVVPVGSVTFFIHDESINQTQAYNLYRENYFRLTVDPGLWMAFKGENEGVNLILNIASIPHEPSESESAPIETFSITRDMSS